MIKISASILSANDKIKAINNLNKENIDYFHIDVMDNKFVPNKSFDIEEINKALTISKKPNDIHLMVNNPETYINKINKLNIEYITFHIEINNNIDKIINLIKSYNIKVGLAIKPNTNMDILKKYIDKIDLVLVMSVEPGFGGQKFIESTYEKINEIKKLKKDIIIEVDGGIKDYNIKKIEKYADIAVIGSYITKSNNYKEAINNLKK